MPVNITEIVAQELRLTAKVVGDIAGLLSQDCSIPFMARHRRGRIGGLDEDGLARVRDRLLDFIDLEERKAALLEKAEKAGRLTDDLQRRVAECTDALALDDLFPAPRSKRSPKEGKGSEGDGPGAAESPRQEVSRKAALARTQGLEGLAERMLAQTDAEGDNLFAIARQYVVTDPKDADGQALTGEEREARLVPDPEAALQRAAWILPERIAEDPDVRRRIRAFVMEHGRWEVSPADGVSVDAGRGGGRSAPARDAEGGASGDKGARRKGPDARDVQRYKPFFGFSQPLRGISGRDVLAIRRGEKEHVLKSRLALHPDTAREALERIVIRGPSAWTPQLRLACAEAWSLLASQIEFEVKRSLKERAEAEAGLGFAKQLREKLLAPGVGAKPVVGLFPGPKRTVRFVALEADGSVVRHAAAVPLEISAAPAASDTPATPDTSVASDAPTASDTPAAAEASAATPEENPSSDTAADASATSKPVVAPSAPPAPPPQRDLAQMLDAVLADMPLAGIAVPQGEEGRRLLNAARDWTRARGLLSDIPTVAVDAAGLDDYAQSDLGREELARVDGAVRPAVGLARRLQDPLAEWVKVPIRDMELGPLASEINPQRLKRRLDEAVEVAVNRVGVDLNRAGWPLLARVSGLNELLARALVAWRIKYGPFKSRTQLAEALRDVLRSAKDGKDMDESRLENVVQRVYTQAVSFVRVKGGDNPLDNTPVPPDREVWVHEIAAALGLGITDLVGHPERMADLDKARFADRFDEDFGAADLDGLIEDLGRGASDPRGEFQYAHFSPTIARTADLEEGLVLDGVVTNVARFGCFVDIGVEQDGLVHISEISNRFIPDLGEVLRVGQVVKVRVIKLDRGQGQFSLSIKQAGGLPDEAGEERPRPPRREFRGPRPEHRDGPRPEGRESREGTRGGTPYGGPRDGGSRDSRRPTHGGGGSGPAARFADKPGADRFARPGGGKPGGAPGGRFGDRPGGDRPGGDRRDRGDRGDRGASRESGGLASLGSLLKGSVTSGTFGGALAGALGLNVSKPENAWERLKAEEKRKKDAARMAELAARAAKPAEAPAVPTDSAPAADTAEPPQA